MAQKNKQLLLADLCARLPYGVFVNIEGFDYDFNGKLVQVYFGNINRCSIQVGSNISYSLEETKPWLRPMSSMTEEEREDFWWNVLDMDWREDLCLDDDSDEEMETAPFPFMENGCGFYLDNFYLHNSYAVIDWLNEHHFDYRGLIEKGLALEAPEGMYKTKEQL